MDSGCSRGDDTTGSGTGGERRALGVGGVGSLTGTGIGVHRSSKVAGGDGTKGDDHTKGTSDG